MLGIRKNLSRPGTNKEVDFEQHLQGDDPMATMQGLLFQVSKLSHTDYRPKSIAKFVEDESRFINSRNRGPAL